MECAIFAFFSSLWIHFLITFRVNSSHHLIVDGFLQFLAFYHSFIFMECLITWCGSCWAWLVWYHEQNHVISVGRDCTFYRHSLCEVLGIVKFVPMHSTLHVMSPAELSYCVSNQTWNLLYKVSKWLSSLSTASRFHHAWKLTVTVHFKSQSWHPTLPSCHVYTVFHLDDLIHAFMSALHDIYTHYSNSFPSDILP